MFGLFKLAAYALLGYALYEFFRGLTTEVQKVPAIRRHPMGESIRRSIEQEIQAQTSHPITGGGEGMTVATHSSDGGSTSHRVGRGVVQR